MNIGAIKMVILNNFKLILMNTAKFKTEFTQFL